MVKLLSLAANLGYIPRVQKPGPRPMALAWLWLSKNSGQAKAHPRPKVRPGFWPQARASTSLTTTVAVSPTSTTTTTMVAGSPTSLTTTTMALPGHSCRQQQQQWLAVHHPRRRQQRLLRHPRRRRLGLRTVRIMGTAVMNTGQTGENQTKTGRSSIWAIPNGSGRV